MQPQQTDVLDVYGPAVAPSIIEGGPTPTSPLIEAEELFGDAPVVTGPVAIVEEATAASEEHETLPVGDAAPAARDENVSTDAPGTDDAAETSTTTLALGSTEPSTENTPTETTVNEVEDAVTEPERTVEMVPADTDEDDMVVTAQVERVQPPEPELVFTLEQLEAETTGRPADVLPAPNAELTDSTDGTAPTDDVEPDVAPAAPVAVPEADAAPAVVSAPPVAKTATYEEIQNSEQEFVGAIKAKKFPLIDPDQFWVMIAAVVALGVILAANLTASFTSVYAMAEYTGAPKSVQWVPVVALDFAIVGFSWALMVFGARGDKVWSTRLYLFVVTGFSVVANFMHTYTHWNGDLSSPEAVFGVVFSSAVPLFSLVATEELIRLVFIRRNRRKTKKAVA
ncbi:hypothetical protein [Curtobacterium sp. MCSS17_016]|uniref:hypothetical protein n=1 Tax=Curtobacterium sp. MCSS17_016 TaxID=2175644 RepID=UPI000DA6DC3E|nr:hypothetical protein [Curtobacterium sp. MCSS17_016]WIE81490.1 hypothetical protein DEJ19_019835 [Curtobacterium sp. MCSS17_016]